MDEEQDLNNQVGVDVPVPRQNGEIIGGRPLVQEPELRPRDVREEVESIGRAVPQVENDPTRGRKITIEPVHYGFIVKVGCHTFALEQPETVADKLKEYLKDPQAIEKKWFAGELFNK